MRQFLNAISGRPNAHQKLLESEVKFVKFELLQSEVKELMKTIFKKQSMSTTGNSSLKFRSFFR